MLAGIYLIVWRQSEYPGRHAVLLGVAGVVMLLFLYLLSGEPSPGGPDERAPEEKDEAE